MVAALKKPENSYKGLKLAGAIVETILGIPFWGGLLILSMFWSPLFLMLAFHIVALILLSKSKQRKTPAILGIVASTLGWIPFVGMILHIITAVLYWIAWQK